MLENPRHGTRLRPATTARSRLYGALVGLTALVAACQSGGGAGTESGASFELDVPNCGGFTAQDAAAVLGLEPSVIEDSSQALGDDSKWCIFASKDDSSISVNFTVSRAESSEAAAEDFAQFLSHAGIANDVLGEEGDQAHKVPDLGDEAVWTPMPGILVARIGRYSLQVNAPQDESTQRRIAHLIVDPR